MSDEAKKPASADDASLRRIDSSEIFRGDVEVVIEHRGMRYRLRQTKQGKLILYK